MVSIARKNLFHDKKRFTLTWVGVAAALILILFGWGMFIGILDEVTLPIDEIAADIWGVQEGNKDLISSPSFIPEDIALEVEKIEGVATLHKLIIVNSKIEKDNVQLPISIIGLDLEAEEALHWEFVAGVFKDLQQAKSVIVDRSVEISLGPIAIGDELTINGVSRKVVGITTGAKSFIYPYAHLAYEDAQNLFKLSRTTNFMLINVRSGFDPSQVAEHITKIAGIDAFAAPTFKKNTQHWQIYDSMMGVGIGSFVAIGFFTGTLIISLTIYSATYERIPEFGTLKAIGATKTDIYRILVEQVFIIVTCGFILGSGFAGILTWYMTSSSLFPVKITGKMLLLTYFLTLLLAMLGTTLAARIVNKLDPAIVFRT